jgi:tetratricopeptide (TPR) repeat protein
MSWPATIPQLLALAAAVTIGWLTTQSSNGVFFGAAAYLIYSIGSRKLIPRAHRRGIRLSQAQQFEAAIVAHKESYDFFTRHARLDRFRSITMMSPSAMSYREMALINIAFAYSQIGQGEKAKEYYQRAQEEFPDSGMATAALRMIESVERSHVEHQNAK